MSSHECSHGHSHDHDHDHGAPPDTTEAISTYTLYSKVDHLNVRCLNEREENMCRNVIKPWEDRMNDVILTSDADEQLLIYVPFTGLVRLKSILIRCPRDLTAPSSLKVYANRDDLDFSNLPNPPTEQFSLPNPLTSTNASSLHEDIIELPVKRQFFQNIRSLSIFVENEWTEEEVTNILFLGFRGEFTPLNKDPLITLYEAAPNPSDHKIKGAAMDQQQWSIG